MPFLPATRTPATLDFPWKRGSKKHQTHIDRRLCAFVVHVIHGSSSPRHRGARGPRRGLPPVLRRGGRRRRADDDGPRRGAAAAGGAVRRDAGAVRGGERGGAGGGRWRRRAPAAGVGGAAADKPVHQLVQVAHLHRRPANGGQPDAVLHGRGRFSAIRSCDRYGVTEMTREAEDGE